MKRIIFFLLLFVSATTSAQMDSSQVRYNDQRGNIWFTVHNVPAWKIDGINYTVRGGDTIARVRANGVFTAEELNILPNGSDMTSQINSYVGLVHSIRLVSDSARPFLINGAVNLKGTTILPENGNYFTGTGSIDSITYSASDYALVFGPDLTLTNVKSAKGYATPQHFGAKGDGTTDDSYYINRAIYVVNQNKDLYLQLTPGNYYSSSNIYLMDGIKVAGSGIRSTRLLLNQGVQIRNNDAPVKDVSFGGLKIEMVGSGSNLNAIYFNTTSGMNENIYLHDLNMQMHRKGNFAIFFGKIKNGKGENITIDSSNNVSWWTTDCENISLNRIFVTNSGRSGITRGENVNGYVLTNFIIDGFSQNVALADGGLDSYGPNNRNFTISNGIIKSGYNTFEDATQHTLIRDQGNHDGVYSNIVLVAQSTKLLYAIRDANRNADASSGVRFSNITIKVDSAASYGTLINQQGSWDVDFDNVTIDIDSNAVAQITEPDLIRIQAQGSVDTVRSFKFSGDIKLNGSNARILRWDTPVGDIDMTGTKVYGLTNATYLYSTTYPAKSFRWRGGLIQTSMSGALFRLNNIVRVFDIQGLVITKPNNNIWLRESGYTGTIVPGYNTVNGVLTPTIGGSVNRLGIFYNGSVNHTVNDTTGIVECNRTASNMNVTLPVASEWPGRPITIKNVSATRGVKVTNVAGGDKDSLVSRESVTYVPDSSGWRAVSFYSDNVGGGGGGGDMNMSDTTTTIATKYDLSAYTPVIRTLTAGFGLQGGGNLTANRSFNVDSSIIATRARLNHVRDSILALLAGYDTLTADYVRDGDSLRLTLGDKEWSVYAPSSGGGGGTSQWRDTTGGITYSGGNIWHVLSDGYFYLPGASVNGNYLRGSGTILYVNGSGSQRFTVGGSEKIRMTGTTLSTSIPMGIGSSVYGNTSRWLGIDASTTSRAQINLEAGPAPTSPNTGDIYRSNVDDHLYYYDGSNWRDLLGYTAIDTGSYYPTVDTLGSHITGYTVGRAFYEHMGDRVRVWGTITITSTASTTLTDPSFGLSLPPAYPSTFSDDESLAGSGSQRLFNDVRAISVWTGYFASPTDKAWVQYTKTASTSYSCKIRYSYDYIIQESAE